MFRHPGTELWKTHVDAHINQRTRGCWPLVWTEALRMALPDVSGEGPSPLTPVPIAPVNQDLMLKKKNGLGWGVLQFK